MTATDSDPARVRLPEVLDLTTAATLTRDLLALRGRPVLLDASRVTRLGGLGLQVLLAARLTWRADRQGFAVIEPSDAFRAGSALLGAGLDDLSGAIPI